MSYYTKDRFDTENLHELLKQDILPSYTVDDPTIRNVSSNAVSNASNASSNVSSNTSSNAVGATSNVSSNVASAASSAVSAVSNEPKSTEIIEQYVILDSFVKVMNSSTELGEYNWIFNTQGQTTNESIGITSDIDNVISIQIASFFLPIIEDAIYMDHSIEGYGTIQLVQNNTAPSGEGPTMVVNDPALPYYGQYPHIILQDGQTYKRPWIHNPFTQIPHCNRITIQIKEAGLQSYSNLGNVRYNFEFYAQHNNRFSTNPNFLTVKPLSGSNWDEFTFTNPLRNLNSLSLVFRNPDASINFEPDVMYRSFLSLVVDATPPTGSYIIVTTQFQHKLLAGDRIFIRNFVPRLANGSTNTLFPTYLINYITREMGHVCNSITPGFGLSLLPATEIATPTEFGLDPAIKLLDPIDPNITISMPGLADIYIAKRRIRIPMRIKSIKHNKFQKDT